MTIVCGRSDWRQSESGARFNRLVKSKELFSFFFVFFSSSVLHNLPVLSTKGKQAATYMGMDMEIRTPDKSVSLPNGIVPLFLKKIT